MSEERDITTTDPDVKPSEVSTDRVGLEPDSDVDVITAADGHDSGDDDSDKEDDEEEVGEDNSTGTVA